MTASSPSDIKSPGKIRAIAMAVGCAVLLIASVLVTYWPITRNGFVEWDDPDTIVSNPDFNAATRSNSLQRWPGYLTETRGHLYAPLTYLAWDGLWKLSRNFAAIAPSAAVFHGASVLLHTISSLVVFLILRRWCDGKSAPAFVGALLFALHPIQVEAIAWASGLKDALCGFFSLTAIWLLGMTARDPADEHKRQQGNVTFVLSAISVAAALFSKPAAIALPVIALIFAAARRKSVREKRRALRAALVWGLIALPFLIVGARAQSAPPVEHVSAPARLVVAADALATYAFHLVWPVDLTVDYGHSPGWVLQSPGRAVVWIVPVSLGLLAFRCRRRWPWMWIGLALFVAPLLPVLGLIPFDFQQYSTVADHYVYVAMLGPSLMLACVIAGMKWRKVAVAIACVPLWKLATLANLQAQSWQDSGSVFGRNLAINPDSAAGNRVFGFLAARAGDERMARRYYLSALRINPHDAYSHFNLANLVRLEEPQLAIEHYADAERDLGDVARLHINWGVTLVQLNEPVQAESEFQKALLLNPNSVEIRTNLAMAEWMAGDRENAISRLKDVLQRDPNYAPAERALERIEHENVSTTQSVSEVGRQMR